MNEGSISKDNIAGKYNAESYLYLWNLQVDNVHGLNILSILSKHQHEWKKELFLMCKQDWTRFKENKWYLQYMNVSEQYLGYTIKSIQYLQYTNENKRYCDIHDLICLDNWMINKQATMTKNEQEILVMTVFH